MICQEPPIRVKQTPTRMTGTTSRMPRRGNRCKTGWLNAQEVGSSKSSSHCVRADLACHISGQRLRESKKSLEQRLPAAQQQRCDESNDKPVGESSQCTPETTTLQITPPGSLDLISYFEDAPVVRSSSSDESSSASSSIGQALSMNYELRSPLTVFGALFINGEIMGLSNCTVIPTRSLPVSPDVPLSLHPSMYSPSILP